MQLRSRPWQTFNLGATQWLRVSLRWVLYDLPSPLNTPCHSSPTSRETLCALDCLTIHDVGLPATFVPSLANGTVRNRCCYVRLLTLDQAWPPSWRPSQVTQRPGRSASCRLTWGRSIR